MDYLIFVISIGLGLNSRAIQTDNKHTLNPNHMELNENIITKAAIAIQPQKSRIEVLEQEIQNLAAEHQLLSSQSTEMHAQIHWSRKYILPLFGIEVPGYLKYRQLKKNEEEKKQRLLLVKKELKKETEALDESIKEYLLIHAEDFKRFIDEKNKLLEFYQTCFSYETFLLDAEQQLTDALLWSSWERLLTHPKAKKGLAKFKNEAENFLRSANEYQTRLGLSMRIHGIESLISFPSEQAAFNSIQRILSTVRNLKKDVSGRIAVANAKLKSIYHQIENKTIE